LASLNIYSTGSLIAVVDFVVSLFLPPSASRNALLGWVAVNRG